MGKCERYKELQELLRIMPELTAYNISLKPKTANYRYCRECRVFFNSSTDLRRCPICGGKLRSGPRVKRGLVYVDPMERLNKSRRQTTLGDFLSGLWRQMVLDEFIRG